MGKKEINYNYENRIMIQAGRTESKGGRTWNCERGSERTLPPLLTSAASSPSSSTSAVVPARSRRNLTIGFFVLGRSSWTCLKAGLRTYERREKVRPRLGVKKSQQRQSAPIEIFVHLIEQIVRGNTKVASALRTGEGGNLHRDQRGKSAKRTSGLDGVDLNGRRLSGRSSGSLRGSNRGRGGASNGLRGGGGGGGGGAFALQQSGGVVHQGILVQRIR